MVNGSWLMAHGSRGPGRGPGAAARNFELIIASKRGFMSNTQIAFFVLAFKAVSQDNLLFFFKNGRRLSLLMGLWAAQG